ncbi:MAG: PEP-CTERM sorting domain-containing protein [Planctomycetota bacterium]
MFGDDLKRLGVGFAACGLALAVGLVSTSADAGFIATTDRISLDDLDDGQTLQVGDKIFGDFSFSSFGTGGAIAPAAADLFVTGGIDTDTGDIGLKFEESWNAASGQTLNVNFDFTVMVAPEAPDFFIDGVSAILLNASATGNGVVNFSETVLDGPVPAGDLLGVLSASVDAIFADIEDGITFDPVKKIHVFKDISVTGGVQGSGHLSEFFQFYSQVPEPGSILLLLSGGTLMAMRRRYA